MVRDGWVGEGGMGTKGVITPLPRGWSEKITSNNVSTFYVPYIYNFLKIKDCQSNYILSRKCNVIKLSPKHAMGKFQKPADRAKQFFVKFFNMFLSHRRSYTSLQSRSPNG